ncbi:hypothetical protein [Macrococcoides caseolyticum]|uniref:hypothetical protein n=1 Tax=Macrococcoides caseolyticum TaxID=69966 RepID=UPI0011A8724F|nr:hypothetical protein [Macrococcus caseolyticus]
MSLEVIALSDLLAVLSESEVQEILNTFRSRDFSGQKEAHEVEDFLINLSIRYDKNDFSKTHLIFSTFKGEKILVGYYSIAIKSLDFTKRQASRFPSRLRGSLKNKATFIDKETGNFAITGYLIGQIGKNFDSSALSTQSISGIKILELAYQSILDAQRLTGGSYVWLEYEDHDKLRELYKKFGFQELVEFKTQNGLCLAVKRIKQ